VRAERCGGEETAASVPTHRLLISENLKVLFMEGKKWQKYLSIIPEQVLS
jgi:hypothetical protein